MEGSGKKKSRKSMSNKEYREGERIAAERRWQDRKDTLEKFAAVKRGEVDHKSLPRAKFLIKDPKLKEKLMGK